MSFETPYLEPQNQIVYYTKYFNALLILRKKFQELSTGQILNQKLGPEWKLPQRCQDDSEPDVFIASISI